MINMQAGAFATVPTAFMSCIFMEKSFMPQYYLAIDIGASSGRHIVGWQEDGKLKTDEVYRFPNGVVEEGGHLTWDIDALASHVKKGIAAAKEKYAVIDSLSIDTWALDYVLMRRR